MISILMPAKNASRYIRQTLDSIIDQSISEWELIITDDHSTDDTIEIIQAYAEKDSRIKCISNNGKGIIDALETAYTQSSGDLITRMDADDLMHARKLESLQDLLMNASRSTVATGMVQYFSEEGLGDGFIQYEAWLNHLMERENNFSDIYKECVIPSPCWMIRRSDLENIGGLTTGRYPEDYELCFRMMKHGLQVKTVKKIIHYWRDYPERTSRNDPNYADNNFFDLKVDYFLDISYTAGKILKLIGAGRKGKAIAQRMLNRNVAFDWYTNNERKIAKEIYGQVLQSYDQLEPDSSDQILVLISNPTEQAEVDEFLKQRGLCLGDDYFFFC